MTKCAHCGKAIGKGWVETHKRLTYAMPFGPVVLCSTECEAKYLKVRSEVVQHAAGDAKSKLEKPS